MNKFLYEIPARLDAERLFLRPYQAGDGDLYFAASQRNHEHLSVYESDNVLCHLQDEQQTEAVVRELFAQWIAREHFFWGIFNAAAGEWCGQIYVRATNWDLPEFTIGYIADVNWEGKGYISEAVKRTLAWLFNDMNAQRVISDCHEQNRRSWQLLERCGFTREGHLRQNRQNPDGSFHGDYLYGLLRSEYFAK